MRPVTKMTKPGKNKVARLSRKRPAKRARGWFFAEYDILPYRPHGVVLGQGNADSCVAACCRMLLADYDIEAPEAYLRDALEVNGGAWLSKVPAALAAFGISPSYQYRNDLLLDDLREAVQWGTAIAYLARPDSRAGHAILVEAIEEEFLAVRDPLPENLGKAYRVRLADFERLWLRPSTGRGIAVVMIG